MTRRIEKELQAHGDIRLDPYYWLKERENPQVLEFLKAENARVESALAPYRKLRDELFVEMKNRIPQEDSSAPYRYGDYFYYFRYESQREYPIYCRRKLSPDAPEEVLLDANVEAEGKSYYSLGHVEVSPDHQKLAFSFDTQGRRIYEIRVRDLQTSQDVSPTFRPTTGEFAWAADNRTLFFGRQDIQTLRSCRIYRSRIDLPDEVLIYEETDPTYNVYVSSSRSRKHLFIHSHSTLTTEYRFLKAEDPEGAFRIFHPRERGHEYHVSDGGDRFYVLSNAGAKNFRVLECSLNQTSRDGWREVIPHRPDTLVESVHAFENALVLEEYRQGLPQIQIWDRHRKIGKWLAFEDPTYSAEIGNNAEFRTESFQFRYNSLTTPPTTYEQEFLSDNRKVIKRQEVRGGFDSSKYLSERFFAKSHDGTLIPISVVYRRDLAPKGAIPTVLYGYGSYGLSIPAAFNANRLSLLDRGFAFAIAHIRGGSEMGRQWYEDGKLLKKKNTFLDFVACGEFLIDSGFTRSEHLYAMGGSAGGLLVGAVLNMRPDLFHGAIAAVPFVDVVTTMLDPSIPLTTGEFDEWGDPQNETSYHYMKSYSPYDNVKAQDYPHLLVTTGFHDSQVQYWEPAKWVAKLRETKTDSNLLLLHTNFDTGHGGASGRFESLKEIALEYTFLLSLENSDEN